MIKAIIFDCFGVLYPSASRKFYESNKELFKNSPEKLAGLNSQIDLGEITRAEFFNGLEELTQIPADKIRALFDEELKLPDKNLIGFIEKLKSDYKIALLSNAGREEIEIIYRDKIDKLFDVIVVSYQVHLIKPDSKIYIECINRLGLKPEECLFVDDIKGYTKAAEMLGMKTILYPEFGNIPQELQFYLKAPL